MLSVIPSLKLLYAQWLLPPASSILLPGRTGSASLFPLQGFLFPDPLCLAFFLGHLFFRLGREVGARSHGYGSSDCSSHASDKNEVTF